MVLAGMASYRIMYCGRSSVMNSSVTERFHLMRVQGGEAGEGGVWLLDSEFGKGGAHIDRLDRRVAGGALG